MTFPSGVSGSVFELPLSHLMLMARFHTVTMLPTRSVLPCQSSTLHTRARARGSPAIEERHQQKAWHGAACLPCQPSTLHMQARARGSCCQAVAVAWEQCMAQQRPTQQEPEQLQVDTQRHS